MTQQLGLRFLPQCTVIRSSLQRTYRGFVGLEVQPLIARLHRTVSNFSWLFADPRANTIHLMQRVVRQNQPFRRNTPQEQSNCSWIVLLAIALAAATLANKKSEAEEAELSWNEVEQIALLFDLDLPQTRTPEDLKRASYKCFNAVFQACLEGDWTLIDQVSTATLSKLTDTWGQTLLIAAAGEGNEGAVKCLLKRKIALQKTDREGNTPLHAAAKGGYAHLVPLLWDYYVTDPNSQGKNSYHIAIEHGHLSVLKTLITKQPTSVPLKEGNLSLSLLALCVRYSRKECLDYLLQQRGYQLEEEFSKLGSLLHVAIFYGQFGILKNLVSRSEAAPLLQKYDDQGRNPLALACYLGDLEAVDFLYQKVGDAKGHNGWTAAHWAVAGKQAEVLELLAYLSMNLEIRDKEGNRPEDLLKEDTSFEAKRIKNILNGLIQNKELIKNSRLDFLSQPPEGIVFKGGGPRGLAYLAALRVLKEKRALDQVQKTAGTSAGAITAAIFALDPQLKDIDSLEKLDLMQFLDPVPGKEPLLKAMLSAKDKESTLSKIVSGGFEIAKGAWNPLKLYNTFSQLDGICEGEALRKWIEAEVRRRTGIENCTFGELRKEIQKGKKYLHLHVYTTRLEAADPKDKILHFSSENPEWDDIVISDAIRASMSIPGVYKPYIVREKKSSKSLNPRADLGPCVDGGLVKNFPIDAFDTPTDGYYSGFNRRTLGLCLKDIDETGSKTPPVQNHGILDIVKACAGVYWAAEEIYVETEENSHRIIKIPVRGVGLCDFNLTDEQKANLLKGGREGIENSVFAKARGEPGLLVHLKASNVPTRLPSFTGRQEELRTLEKTFISDPPSPNDTVVRLIYGLGGMGKTELTRAFVLDHQHDFSITWFINSASPEMRNQSYRELAEKLKISILDKEPPEQIERKVHNHLKNHSYEKPWLLIYDNVEKEFTPPQGGYVLMTSRKKEVWANEKERIPLDGFTPAVSIKFLQDITQKQSPRMAELAQVLGHFPLALNQAACYIHEANCSIEDYLTALKKNPVRGKMEPSARYAATLQNVWQITLERLEKENPKASAWLKICAHLNPDDISDEWLTDWLKTQPSTESWDKTEITKALLNLSLIRPNGEGVYMMHRLMQGAVRETEGAEKKFTEAFELVKNRRRDFQDWREAEKWVAQASTIGNSPFFQNIDQQTQAAMFDNIGRRLRDLGRYQEALEHAQKALKIREKRLPPDHPDLAMSYNNIGGSLRDLGRHPEALEHAQKALKIREKRLPPDHPDLAMSYNNIGGSLRDLGRHPEALEHGQKALKIMEKRLPPDHLDLASSYNNVGMSLKDLGRHPEALEHAQKALKVREKRLPPDHPDLARSYNNVGMILSDLGRHPEALEHAQKALKIWEKGLPPDHPDLAMSYNNIGLILSDLGRHPEALEHAQKALKVREKRLPPDHPDLARSYNNIGSSLSDLGRHQEALEHAQKALKISASREKHHYDELYLENFIHTLNKQSDKELCEKAKQEILALYTERLGKDHPLIKELEKACPKGWLRWPF